MKRLSWRKRVLLPILGVGLIGALAWQSRRLTAGAARERREVDSSQSQRGSALQDSGRVHADGRLVTYPGAEVTVGSEVSGRIVQLRVQEQSQVRKGDVIAELDASETRAGLIEARARLAEAEADARFYDGDDVRIQDLAESGVVSRQQRDRSRHQRDAARARRDVAAAVVGRLEAVLAKTRILAPISGVVTARYAQPGETVVPGAPLATIADLRRTRVEAEIDEFDVGSIALGSRAIVAAEGFPDMTWNGRVEEIPDAVTGRRLKPQDPGRPADVRVLLVKIALDAPAPLKLGQRVEVSIGGRDARELGTATPRSVPHPRR